LGQNIALKTGILFAGCIYGVAGHVDNAFNFIEAVKMYVAGASSIFDAWEKLNELIMFYDFPTNTKDGFFQLLLSSRHSGQSEFYILDSNRHLTQYEEEWVSIGKGKELLDSLVTEKYQQIIKETRRAFINTNVPSSNIYPYFLCLMLSELTLTFQRSTLEKATVEGPFNFVYQTSAIDKFQSPTLYIFSDMNWNTNRIVFYGYKICRIPKGLYIESNDPSLLPGISERRFLLHDPTTVKLNDIPNKQEFDQQIRETVESLPYYYFCGVGYTQTKYQYGHECHIALDNNPETLIINQLGDEISKGFEDLIKKHFADRRELPGGGEGITIYTG
jgi:hypothetical protein